MIGAGTKRPTAQARKVLESIIITSMPTKVSYTVGDALDLAGLVVKAVFNTGDEVITGYTTSPVQGTILSATDEEVVVSYTYNGVTATASFAITVKAAKIKLTLTGSGNATYCYMMIGSTKYTSATTVEIDAGTEVTFGVYGYSSTYYGEVKINNVQKLKVTNRSTQTFEWTPEEDASISMSYTSTSTRRNGKINVTT